MGHINDCLLSDFITLIPQSATMQPNDFVKRFKQVALDIQKESKIPALIILAQGAGESGWGAKAPGNMYFGIKADAAWKGQTQLIRTREVIDGKSVMLDLKFRAYTTPEESFRDHAHFLHNNSRYARVFNAYDKKVFREYIRTQNPKEYTKYCSRLEAFPRLSDAYRFAWIMAVEGYATAPNYFEFLVSMIESVYVQDTTLA